ncbi:MAG: hypothetical protein WC457_04590 [Patescibacteria group bacterium]
MLTIPLYSFLIIYAILFLFFVFFFLVNVGHIVATGSITFGSFIMTMFILLASLAVLWFTWYILQNMDWTQGLTIFNKEWFGGIVSNNQIY